MTLSVKDKHWILNSRLLGRELDKIPGIVTEEISLWKDDENIPKMSSGWFIDLYIDMELRSNGIFKYTVEIGYEDFQYEGLEERFTKLFSFEFDPLLTSLEDYF